MSNEYRMSQARLDELQTELNYLKTTRSDEVAEQIKIARGFGDLSENSEYDEAKNEQGKLYSRIAELEEILQNAVVVDENTADNDAVTIGCKVTVADGAGKVLPIAYKIVGSQESDPMPTRSPRYAFAPPKTMAKIEPRSTDTTVNSGIILSAGT